MLVQVEVDHTLGCYTLMQRGKLLLKNHHELANHSQPSSELHKLDQSLALGMQDLALGMLGLALGMLDLAHDKLV